MSTTPGYPFPGPAEPVDLAAAVEDFDEVAPTPVTPVEEDSRPSADEILDSMTGYDEQGIEKAFGANITTLAKTDPAKFSRALVFVLRRHDGLKHVEAYDAVMKMTLGQVDQEFRQDASGDELPGSEAGKDVG